MENTYRIPTMEDINAQYEEITDYMSQLKTKEDVLEFQKEYKVTMEINYDRCELYDEKKEEIEVIRCESWGDLDHIYYYLDSENENPFLFDVWCDFLELDFIDSTTITDLEEKYADGIKYILTHDFEKEELFEVIRVLRKQLIDYNDIVEEYGIDPLIVEEYESKHYEIGYGDIK